MSIASRRTVRFGSAALALAFAASAAGCSSPPAEASSGSWTVLTYSIADTDLEPYMMVDVDEMGQVGTQHALNLVAFVDRSADYSSDPVLGLDDWVGAKVLEVQPGSAEVLQDLGDVNTGDPAVLSDFISESINAYPADNYALIISDHGASWPGVGGDESSDEDSLSLAEINDGIASGLEAAGVDKLQLLGFDACLMATYEVASTLAPLADRMLASQELEPGHGWDYTALQSATAGGGATVDELGSALIAGFESQAKVEGDDSEITLSLIDLTRLPAIDEALNAFSGALTERAAGVAPVVGRTLASTLGFGASPDPAQDSFMTDLGILAGEIGVDALDVSDEADTLVRAINDAVIDKVDGQATKGATGLSIYFPPQPEYFADDYRNIVTDGNWIDFLTAYYGAGDGIPADALPAFDGGAEVSFNAEGLTIAGAFGAEAEDSLSESYIRYGFVEDDGSVSFFGQEPAYPEYDGSGMVEGTFDLTTLTITDGEDTTSAFLQLSTDEEGDVVTIDVPMAYYSPEDVEGETYQDALLSLTLDGASGELLSEVYYSHDEASGNYGELGVEADGIIVPQLLNVLADGSEEWLGTTDTGLYADLPNLEYDLTDLPSGTKLYIELWVVDFGGNADMVSAYVTVP